MQDNELDALNALSDQPKYDRSFSGAIGRLGAEGTLVRYLQLNVGVQELEQLGLVPEVPGSEQWPIRQLFQRDIDSSRVESEIMPYFEDADRVKFFNPLTIAALPLTGTSSVDIERSEESVSPSDDRFEHAVQMDGFYRLSYNERLGQIEWNSSKVKLIAIDGQHRLSALKRLNDRLKRNPSDSRLNAVEFDQWRIPVVVLTVGHAASEGSAARVLDKTREIFVTINKQAREPSRSRTILLNDYSASAIAVQETLDGCRAVGVPLAFFNWRDSHSGARAEPRSVYLIGVDDLEDIVTGYMFGADNSKDNNAVIAVSDEQLENIFWFDRFDAPDRYNIQDLSDGLRERFRETIFPAMTHIFQNCKPLCDYVNVLSKFDSEANSDVAQHAWSEIVYGKHYGGEAIRDRVSDEKERILNHAAQARKEMGSIFNKAIGIRAIFSAFADFYEKYCQDIEIVPQKQAAQVFVDVFNRLYDKKIFDARGSGESEFIDNFVFDPNDSIVNYRVEHVRDAFGACIAYGVLRKYEHAESHELFDIEDRMLKKLKAEYRKQVRPGVKDELVNEPNEKINEEVNKRAEKQAKDQFKRISRKLGRLRI